MSTYWEMMERWLKKRDPQPEDASEEYKKGYLQAIQDTRDCLYFVAGLQDPGNIQRLREVI